ncbi:MAG: carboxypeptidase-like regulatory domain-containing protein [Bacteroidota bacterium]
MTIISRDFNMKIEELVTSVKVQEGNLTTDFIALSNYKAMFTTDWQDNYHGEVLHLDDIVNNKIKIAELKQMNADIKKLGNSEREILGLIEGYPGDCTGLTIGVKDFGFHEARVCISNGNWDGLVLANAKIKKAVTNNLVKLQAAGLTDEMFDIFKGKATNLDALNTSKNLLEEAKKQVVADNIVFLNTVYADMMKIADAGKRLFKFSNPKKAEGYSIRKLIGKITHKSTKEKVVIDSHICGTVYDFETEENLTGASVCNDSNGKIVVTKADGFFDIGGEASRTTKVIVKCPGYKDKVVDVEITKGTTMELDIDMVKEGDE